MASSSARELQQLELLIPQFPRFQMALAQLVQSAVRKLPDNANTSLVSLRLIVYRKLLLSRLVVKPAIETRRSHLQVLDELEFSLKSL